MSTEIAVALITALVTACSAIAVAAMNVVLTWHVRKLVVRVEKHTNGMQKKLSAFSHDAGMDEGIEIGKEQEQERQRQRERERESSEDSQE